MHKVEDWSLKGIADIEKAAWQAIRETRNVVISAGPGAGKTELLAQKACYLLETNVCHNPRKILALCFKRDAAKNLKNRVSERCDESLGTRFDSYTYDGFFKLFFDHFNKSLPNEYRYAELPKIITLQEPKVRELVIACSDSYHTITDLQVIPIENFERLLLCKEPLYNQLNSPIEDYVRKKVWEFLVKEGSVTFLMISRLFELLVYSNPCVKKCLKATYSHVFLDEFQDTTEIQYQIIKGIFLDENISVTAVGDDKQRIMGWCGAKENIFHEFVHDFKALDIHLSQNYRSNEDLVCIQRNLANAINNDQTPVKSMRKGNVKNVCQIIHFQSYSEEATVVSRIIQHLIYQKRLSPNDICILARHSVSKYAEPTIQELQRIGIKARIEEYYQYILSEPFVDYLISFLTILVKRDVDAWQTVLSYYSRVLDIDSERIIQKNIYLLKQTWQTQKNIEVLIGYMWTLLQFEKVPAVYRQYKNSEECQKLCDDVKKELLKSFKLGRNLSESLDDLKGVGIVPIMTTHKSKGLEFDTIIFLGVEDGAFFSYGKNPYEENCNIFVALSRAKQRAIFTYSDIRLDRNGQKRTQNFRSLQPLIDGLVPAGLKKYDGLNYNLHDLD